MASDESSSAPRRVLGLAARPAPAVSQGNPATVAAPASPRAWKPPRRAT
jgi:hypothetical protein